MKKHGFSLAEVLVTMAIVAISASLLVPAYMKVKPDRYKMKVLNCYKVLNKVTDDLLNNPDLYFRTPIPEDDSVTIQYIENTDTPAPGSQYGCNGLACTQQPNVQPFNDYKYVGWKKYPNLLVDFMQLDEKRHCSTLQCLITIERRCAQGISSNKIKWFIGTDNPSIQYSPDTTYKVIVDMNGEEGPNQSYSDNQHHPDRFEFIVDANGDIIGGDPLTAQYLKNMTNIQKEDDYSVLGD